MEELKAMAKESSTSLALDDQDVQLRSISPSLLWLCSAT